MRGEPWLRIYTSIYEPDDKTQGLSDKLFRQWMLILAAYKRNGESMPALESLARGLKIGPAKVQAVIDALVQAELLDVTGDGIHPHDWDDHQHKSDSSKERTRDWRDRHKRGAGDAPCDVTRGVTSGVTRDEKSTSRCDGGDGHCDVTVTPSDYRLQRTESIQLTADSETAARASSQQQRKAPRTEPGKLSTARAMLMAYPDAFGATWEPPDDATVERILENFRGNEQAMFAWLSRTAKRRRSLGPGDGWGLLVIASRSNLQICANGGAR